MRKILSCVCVVIMMLCLLCGCGKEESSKPAQSNALLGSFTAQDLAGNTVDASVFSGSKLTMINIWGAFCSPCINEMPDLGALNREMEDVQVIGIVIDAADAKANLLPDKASAAQTIVAQTQADYLHLLPSPDLIRAYLYNVQAVPETIFVDAQGNQVGQSYLGARSKDQWQQIILTLLEDMS